MCAAETENINQQHNNASPRENDHTKSQVENLMTYAFPECM